MNEEQILHWLKVLEVVFWGSVKFLVAPFEAERYGFNFRDSFLMTTTGGIIGIVAFTFIGHAISLGWKKLKGVFKKRNAAHDLPKKRFTSTNKMIVRIKMKYGLIGLVITTPSIISIPIGTVVINHFYKKKGRNMILLIISLLLWSLILNGVIQYIKPFHRSQIKSPDETARTS